MSRIEHLPSPIDPKHPAWAAVLPNLQGNILKGHGRDHTAHIFVEFTAECPAIRKWIAQFTQEFVTSAQQQLEQAAARRQDGTPGGLFGSFFLAARGCAKLGFDPSERLFNESEAPDRDRPNRPVRSKFREGMQAYREELGDPPPEEWEWAYRHGRIDAMILLAHDDDEVLEQETCRVLHWVRSVATDLTVERGHALRNDNGDGIEHFGYVDGRSQPLFFQADIDKEARNDGTGQWDPSATPSMVLVPDPLARDLLVRDPHLKEHCFGSYLVFRKLEQNVSGFKIREAALAEELGLTGEDAERAGALAVGRFEDGTPVTLQMTEGRPGPVTNNFDYREDPDGWKCPFHGHIRKVNPRGDIARRQADPHNPALTAEKLLAEERARRITRRGITYGIRNAQEEDEERPETFPTGGVGLLFMCFQSSIAHQFAFIQSRWANNADYLLPGTGFDPIIGQGAPPDAPGQPWPLQYDAPATQPANFGGFVRMRGGEFFFAPSIPALLGLQVAGV